MMWQKACPLTPRVHQPQAMNDSASKKNGPKQLKIQRYPSHLWFFFLFQILHLHRSSIIKSKVTQMQITTRNKLAPFSDSRPISNPFIQRNTFQVTPLDPSFPILPCFFNPGATPRPASGATGGAKWLRPSPGRAERILTSRSRTCPWLGVMMAPG